MDSIVDSLNAAYNDYLTAMASVLESVTETAASGQRTAALEMFKQRWELFRVACDQAEEFVESLKQRIGSECLVDEATGSSSSSTAATGAKPGLTGLPPISAVRLEQMSKAVRWLVIELQQGSGAAAAAAAGGGGAGSSAHGHSPGSFDARFSEDSAQ